MSECRNETSYSVTQWVREELEKNTDPDYREFHKSLVPGMGNFLGVRVPQLRRISAFVSLCSIFFANQFCSAIITIFPK